MKMPNMCPFEKRHFLTWIDLNPNFMQGIKNAKLAISNLALLIPCMEFENFLAQIPSFEVF